MRHRLSNARAALLVTAAFVGTSCTAGSPEVAAPSGSPPASTPPPSAQPPPSVSPSDPQEIHPVSIPALIEKDVTGGDLRIVRALGSASSYTRNLVTYRSGDLTISGLLNVPEGRGPFPVLVLAHGYIDPEVYTTGRGFERSQAYLASRGFAVLHVDYRNHAFSDDDPDNDMKLRLGYVEDVISAVHAVRASRLPALDRDRIGILGRSMGGGVALTVAAVAPDLVDAIVVFAPISSDAGDNFERWINRPGRRELARAVIAAYGSPDDAPDFWRNASARAFFDRVTDPILIHHGTADESVPYEWSRETLAALKAAGADVGMHTYPGEGHAFGPAYPRSMSRTVAFFREHLG